MKKCNTHCECARYNVAADVYECTGQKDTPRVKLGDECTAYEYEHFNFKKCPHCKEHVSPSMFGCYAYECSTEPGHMCVGGDDYRTCITYVSNRDGTLYPTKLLDKDKETKEMKDITYCVWVDESSNSDCPRYGMNQIGSSSIPGFAKVVYKSTKSDCEAFIKTFNNNAPAKNLIDEDVVFNESKPSINLDGLSDEHKKEVQDLINKYKKEDKKWVDRAYTDINTTSHASYIIHETYTRFAKELLKRIKDNGFLDEYSEKNVVDIEDVESEIKDMGVNIE